MALDDESVRGRRRSRALHGVLRGDGRGDRRPHRIGSRCASARSRTRARRRCQRDIDDIKAAMTGRRTSAEAFLPVAAPASVIPDRKNAYYKNDEAMLEAHRRGDAHGVPHHRDVRASACSSTMRARPSPMTAWCRRRALPITANGWSVRSRSSTMRSKAFRRTASAITSAGEAGPDRTPPTCR